MIEWNSDNSQLKRSKNVRDIEELFGSNAKEKGKLVNKRTFL